jgi:hypothetical protein
MSIEKHASKQKLKDFLKSENPSISNKSLDAILSEIGISRDKFSRYEIGKKAARRGYTYVSKRFVCNNIRSATENLIECLLDTDLMVRDELDQYLGDTQFRAELIGKISELKKASTVIVENLPADISRGKQRDLIVYDWVIQMADIYESALKPRKADYRINDKFMYFLNCWKPDEIPEFGDRLSPRTIKRILKHREDLKHEKNRYRGGRARPNKPIDLSLTKDEQN